MKLAQRQEGEVEGGKWTAVGRQQPQRQDEPPQSPSDGATAADDPYRGMSDGEMLQYDF